MTAKTRFLHDVWRLSGWPATRRFHLARHDLEPTQTAILLRYVRVGAATQFGRDHGFAGIRSVEDYRNQVPLRGFDDFANYMARIYAGERDILYPGDTIRLEPTSGTSGGLKLIPYSHALKREFDAGIAPWIDDLLRRVPAVKDGRAYWGVSPAMSVPRPDDCRLPIGFERDEDYLGPFARYCMRTIGVSTPTDVDPEAHQVATLGALLSTPDLRLISIWNPSFLTVMLDAFLEHWQDRVLAKLADPHANRISRCLKRWERGEADQPWRLIWPQLQLVSCWADGWAAGQADAMQARLPHAGVQPKGLLATEGVVTIPQWLDGGWQHVLAATSHFYEFLNPATGAVSRAHELSEEQRYEVIITTGGGLYRYRLNDLVTVRGWYGQFPVLAFEGKAPDFSDLVGEKLSEAHVRTVLEGLPGDGRDAWLQAIPDATPPRYRIGLPYCLPDLDAKACRRVVDDGLRGNPHYNYARELGQLAAPELACLSREAFEHIREPRATRRGTAKPRWLIPAERANDRSAQGSGFPFQRDAN